MKSTVKTEVVNEMRLQLFFDLPDSKIGGADKFISNKTQIVELFLMNL